ncbi:hypothetical protein [Streptomyces camelliae]|uniref:PPE family domain-containing protein n=1 Tax=Streptomyces camelliae TaxID=3004093 RepID=A0ABY7NZ06_9ACTN|nr:hypothetical protein [Streptomyces sp. HUAS 2-6]WBO63471.1 hypothetical protein O1G22_11860 [Streptomyces sp. HUAS 2-6]
MSDDKWQQDPQYKPGVDQADRQVGAVNAVEYVLGGMPFGFGMHVNAFGSTDFENHDLNDMIDLVEQAQPAHLELASRALWDAHQHISDAATELRAHIKAVPWKGEAAIGFRDWGYGLADWSDELATFADKTATQISAAGMGLATVSKSMPHRDPRPRADRKLPTELPKAKQVDSNPDYVIAKKAEADRQEAINQMNKLASYYAVSAGALKGEEGPQPYKAMPPVGVPRPAGLSWDPNQKHYGSAQPVTGQPAVSGHHQVAVSTVPHLSDHAAPVREVHQPVEAHQPVTDPHHQVGTEINTVGTLPPAHATQPGPPAPTIPTAGGGGHTPPLTTGPVTPPITPPVGRTTGYGPAGRLPVSAQGRTGPSGAASGRVPQEPEGQTGRAATGGRVSQGPMGQAARAMGRTTTPTGQSALRGSTQQVGRSPLGRGVTGGTPRMTNTPGGRAGAAGPIGAARNGVVGGRPVTGSTPGSASNSRVPRGMVIGAEEPVSSTQPKGALGQRGVVGAPTAKADPGTSQSVLRSASNPEGVVGAPRNNSGSTLKDSESGVGRTGLGRGAVGEQRGPDGGTGRAGKPAEKEQHRSSQKRRRDVPQKSD